MGIEYDIAELLIRLRSQGVSFDKVLTLGRQGYTCSAKGTRALFAKYGLECTWVPPNPYPQNYSDGLFTALGATVTESLDITSAEKATIIHDLNEPVPAALHNHFDIVLDAGTLEHVFNIPQAFSNCMRMVRVGGKLIIHTVANNYMGHGFYQFSPELFFNLLSTQNGFKTESVLVVEHSPRHRKFEAIAPEDAKSRFETTTFWRTDLICVATKLAEATFRIPQQSDYAGNFTLVAGHKPWQFHKPSRYERFIVEHFPRLTTALKAIKFSALRPSLRLGNRAAFKRQRGGYSS